MSNRTGIQALLVAALLFSAVLALALQYGSLPSAQPTPLRPRPTPEPLVPTPLPFFQETPAGNAEIPMPAPRLKLRPTPFDALPESSEQKPFWREGRGARLRVGVGVPLGAITDYDWGEGWPGWYVTWKVMLNPPQPSGTWFAQMVRVHEGRFQPPLDHIIRAARANPGSLWLIGNEPDVRWQDGVTPEEYARLYGVLYQAIKEADPTAQVAVAGVSQPTPLRLAYLDRVLEAYRDHFGAEMPVDVWNVHAFILREEQDSWGVGIPPGMSATQGQLYEIGDHADLAIFRQQIWDFRRWMAERGLRERPLIVSEYGILMPESYGFPPELVAGFLVDTFDFFLTARDETIGYPADDHRLVQAFCWYSASDTTYPTPNLFDPASRAPTLVGQVFQQYVAMLR